MKRADDLIEEALSTYRERQSVYGASYIKHAEVLRAAFPHGVSLKDDLDFARWSILNLIFVKLIRYGRDFTKPHQDSVRDMGVYAFVLEELDQFAGKPEEWSAWKMSAIAREVLESAGISTSEPHGINDEIRQLPGEGGSRHE